MKKLKLIDTHCDTAFELYRRQESIKSNSCHISLEKSSVYENYTQFFAIWADKRRSDEETYSDFLKISDNFINEVNNNSDKIVIANTFNDMNHAWNSGKTAAFLAVEDARILAGKIERLDELHRRGVKYLTLLWGGNTCIGASHDAEGGLTDFGKEVVRRCFELGIVPDVSHANEKSTDDVIEIAYEYKKPFIASHSDCYSLFSHTRNLREHHLRALIELGGVVGLNLCPWHVKKMLLSGTPKPDFSNIDELTFDRCNVNDVVAHVEKYFELGAENNLGMGCDLDGTDLPDGFSGVDDLYRIADALLSKNYSEEFIDKLFYKNNYNFIKSNF